MQYKMTDIKRLSAIFTGTVLLCCLLSGSLPAEPHIKQFFPSRSILLGHPAYWTIQIQSPVWESQSLQLNPCKGAEVQIAEQRSTVEKDVIRQTYRIQIVPIDLTVVETPSVVITDEKGQSLVLNGKPLIVTSISGPSLQIKDPGPLPAVKDNLDRNRILFSILLVLFSLLLASLFKRYRAARPRQIFLRDLRKAASEIQNNRRPVQIWRLLRSELLWGFPADTWTPSQLKEKARWDLHLSDVAEGLL